ncbi:MAG TPA: STAS domain-containing protein [Myxococcales bacterium]
MNANPFSPPVSPASPHSDRILTLTLRGEWTQADLLELTEDLSKLALRGLKAVVLDLSRVTHLDYRGVPSLVRQADQFRYRGGDIKLVGLSAYLHAILRAVGAETSFQNYLNLDHARSSFGRPETSTFH